MNITTSSKTSKIENPNINQERWCQECICLNSLYERSDQATHPRAPLYDTAIKKPFRDGKIEE